MASQFSGTNGSLVHATASRPIIPTNRRRQPTIERGFSGMKVPIISLEQDLDKSHLNDLVSIVAKESVKLQIKPDSNRPESIKRRSLQKPGVSTSARPELALTTANGSDTKQLTLPTSSNNQPKVGNNRRRGFPLFSPVSRQPGKSGGSKSKGFFAQGEAAGAGGSNAVMRKDGGRLFRLRFGKNKLTSARPKSSNQLDLEIEANTALKDIDSSAVVLHGDDHEQDEGFSAQVAVTTAAPQDEEKQNVWMKTPDAVQQPLAGESSESPSASKHVDSERMTKSKSAKELAERARVAAAELRKSVNAANAATFSSFSRKTEVQGGNAIEHHNQEDEGISNVQIVPPVSPMSPSTMDQSVEGNAVTRAGETAQEQLVQEKGKIQQSNANDKKEDTDGFTTSQAEPKSETSPATFQLLSSSWTPIQRNSVLGGVTNEADIPISAHRMSVLEKQQAPSVPSAEPVRRLSNFAGMLTEVPVRASPGSQVNPGLEISMIEPSSNKAEEEESPNKSRLAAFLSQTNTAPAESTSFSSDDVSHYDENKSKPADSAPSTTGSSGLVKSVVSRLSVKATLPPSVLRIQTPPSKGTSSTRGSIVGDASLSKSVATSPVTVSTPIPPRTAEEIKAMVERNIARMAAFLESVRLAKEAAAKAAEAAKAPPPEQEKPKKAFLKAYLAATASHNAKVRGEPDPATLEPQQPLSRLAAFLAEISPPQPAVKPKRGKPFFRYPSSSAPQTPSATQSKAPQQPSRLSMFLNSSSSSSKSAAAKAETPSKPQVLENPKDSFPSDVETYGDRLRTQYIHVGNKQARSADEDASETKDVVVAQKDVSSSADASSGARRNSKLLVQSSVFRRPSLPRAVSSPSIRDAQTSSNSPKTRSRKNSSASPSPKPASDKKSPVITKSIDLEDKRVSELSSDGRSETVKSVSLKDFSLKETLEKYQRSASGKGKKLLGENDDVKSQEEERRRPSLVNSMSLKNVSLAETLAMYQANSSRSLTSKSNSSN